MQQETNSEQGELYTTQFATKEANRETYLNKEIAAGNPLRVVGNTEQGYCVTFGKYRITDIKDTPEKAVDQLDDNKWVVIINLIGAILGQTDEIKDKIK